MAKRKNNNPVDAETLADESTSTTVPAENVDNASKLPSRKRGRPKGSTNRASPSPVQRSTKKRGRPKGSVNKTKGNVGRPKGTVTKSLIANDPHIANIKAIIDAEVNRRLALALKEATKALETALA